MAATVASKPAPALGMAQDPNSMSIAPVIDAPGGASQQQGSQGSEDAGPKVPPQHQQVKLTDFALVRTLGTGKSSFSACFRLVGFLLSPFSFAFPLLASYLASCVTTLYRPAAFCMRQHRYWYHECCCYG